MNDICESAIRVLLCRNKIMIDDMMWEFTTGARINHIMVGIMAVWPWEFQKLLITGLGHPTG